MAKYTLEELRAVIDHEGLGYALREYGIEAHEIQSTGVALLWLNAQLALRALATKLYEED